MDPDGYTPRARRVLERAAQEAQALSSAQIGTEHLLLAILKEQDSVAARLLNTAGIDAQKMYIDLLTAMGQRCGSPEKICGAASFCGMPLQAVPLPHPPLDAYSRDITELARDGKLDPVIGRENEIQRWSQILSRRTKNNPCLIGEPGVGKTAIVEGLAPGSYPAITRTACGTNGSSAWICPAWWRAANTGVSLRNGSRISFPR